MPGQELAGTPTQAASATCWTSYRPNGAPTAHPTAMPMIGDQRRQAGGALRTRTATVTSVAAAVSGAAAPDVFSGAAVMVSKTIGMTVAAISMMTVPETTGVKMRRNRESRAESANWKSAEMTMRVAIREGPPSTIAATQTAMKAPDVPMMSTCPAPTRPTRMA